MFLRIVFSEYKNYYLLFFDITLNFLKKNIYANLLIRCDDTCVITPYLFIYLFIIKPINEMRFIFKLHSPHINTVHSLLF